MTTTTTTTPRTSAGDGEEEQRLLTVAEAAAATGLSGHTLRYYERIGLLDAVGRAVSGHRRYSAADLAWIGFLTRLRATGMPIRDVARFADLRRRGDATAGQRRAMLEEHRRRVEARAAALATSLEAIADKIAYYRALEAGPP